MQHLPATAIIVPSKDIRRVFLPLFLTSPLLVLAIGCGERSASIENARSTPFELSEDLVVQHNRGVALMGQFEFGQAFDIFASLVKEHPNWIEARVDLAIAALNRQQPGDAEHAADILETVIQRQPANRRAMYCRALLHLHSGETREALGLFRQVTAADRNDGYAAFYVGQCLLQASRVEEALDQFLRAQQIDPHLRSAYYGAFQAARRLGRDDQAQQCLRTFQDLADNPQARLAEIKYTRMGPKAEVRPIDIEFDDRSSKGRPAGAVFTNAESLGIHGDERFHWRPLDAETPSSITVCDIDGDGYVDLFIAGALEADDGQVNAILLWRDDHFELAEDHTLAGVSDVNTALWGDYDNDGLTDVYFCRPGPNQLWRQYEPRNWKDVSPSTKTSGGSLNTIDGAIFDADHDGDLDMLLINDDGPNELLNNNRDGTFTALGQGQGNPLGADGRPSRGLVVADLDTDGDADVVILKKEPPHEVFLNDRFWKYRNAEGFDRFKQTPIHAALAVDSGTDGQVEPITQGDWAEIERAAVDVGVDGQVELISLTENQIVRWSPSAAGQWLRRPIGSKSAARLNLKDGPLAIQDVDGDGLVDLIVPTEAGWATVSLTGQTEPIFQSEAAGLHHWTLALLDHQRGPALIGLRSSEPPIIWNPGPGRFPFAAVSFSGKEAKAQQMRSNASGIGVKFAVRVRGRSTALDTYRQHSGPGQSLQPIAVGLGAAKRIDFVNITWPDGVFQTEIDLQAGMAHRIEETQRQVSSCPVVFAWNGREFQFVTDILGVGGVGFNIGAGQFADPRPWENLLLPSDKLLPKDGTYQIKITEPMEEVCYLDAARLAAYDLPPSWKMSVDERFAMHGPQPSGRPVYYRESLSPVHAINDRNQEVTELVLAADRRAAPCGAVDHRFVGRTEEHVITLTFGRPLNELPGTPTLICDGWIEYPYSQTMFAAWQAAADYNAPTLEAKGADGAWRVVLDQFGYMAGMPREMSVPLPKTALPVSTTQLRIRTNMEIFWDCFRVAGTQPCDKAVCHRLPLHTAIVGEVGFPQRTTHRQRLPHYEYHRRFPLWDTRHPAGFYSQLGEVTPLVTRTDDSVAIIGPGEELHLEFLATLPKLRAEWTRRFVLETNGWCKDMDLLTKDGQTVEPVPLRGETTDDQAERRNALHGRYNSRYRAGT